MRLVYRPDHPKANENGMVPIEIAGPKAMGRSANLYPNFDEYVSPTTGKLISDRGSRREDLRASGCYEWEPSFPGKPRGLINQRFIKKHGLQHMATPETRDKMHSRRDSE